MIVTEFGPQVPGFIVKDVFGNDHVRQLLLALDSAASPRRYSEVRTALGLHPEEFRRSLNTLQKYSMVQSRAPQLDDAPRNAVFLEASALGRLFAALWREMNEDLAKLMAERHIPANILDVIAEG